MRHYRYSYYLFTLLFVLLSLIASLKIFNLHTAYFDIGTLEQIFYEVIQNKTWQKLFYGHIQPLLFIEIIGYFFTGTTYYLVCIQAFFLAFPVLFIPYLENTLRKGNTRHHNTNSSTIWITQLAYILLFAVWYNALFDFHVDHLSVPLGFLFYITYFKKKWIWTCALGILVSFIKEPFALMTVFCGIYIALKYATTKVKDGPAPFCVALLLIIFGTGYFYLSVNIISPMYTSGARSGLDASAFNWMGNSASEMLFYILRNPFTIIKEVVCTPNKIFYLIAIFGSLAFIPLLAPIELIPALPILGISLLSRLDNYYGLGHHYSAGLIAPLIVAFITGMPRAQKLWSKTGLSSKSFYIFLIIIFFSANILLSPSPISRLFWTNKVWSYGYKAYLPTNRDKLISRAIKKHIPSNPDIFVSTQNTLNTSYLAKRLHYRSFPAGVLEPAVFNDLKSPAKTYELTADYVLLDTKRPIFLIDQGCDWIYGKCQNEEIENEYYRIQNEMKLYYNNIYEYDGFSIWKRKKLTE